MTNNGEKLQFHYRIHGQVQGVGFRDWLNHLAKDLDIDGFCRNRSDGTVEVVAGSSKEKTIAQLEEALRKGPGSARVDRIEIDPYPETISSGFEVRPTK